MIVICCNTVNVMRSEASPVPQTCAATPGSARAAPSPSASPGSARPRRCRRIADTLSRAATGSPTIVASLRAGRVAQRHRVLAARSSVRSSRGMSSRPIGRVPPEVIACHAFEEEARAAQCHGAGLANRPSSTSVAGRAGEPVGLLPARPGRAAAAAAGTRAPSRVRYSSLPKAKFSAPSPSLPDQRRRVRLGAGGEHRRMRLLHGLRDHLRRRNRGRTARCARRRRSPTSAGSSPAPRATGRAASRTSVSNAICSTSDDDLPGPPVHPPVREDVEGGDALGDPESDGCSGAAGASPRGRGGSARVRAATKLRKIFGRRSASTRRARGARPPTRSGSRARRRAPPAPRSRGRAAPPSRGSARRELHLEEDGELHALIHLASLRAVKPRQPGRLPAARNPATRPPITSPAWPWPSMRIFPVSCAPARSPRPASRSSSVRAFIETTAFAGRGTPAAAGRVRRRPAACSRRRRGR